jgi:predicted dehydrogenase
MPPVSIDERNYDQGDALKDEIEAFLKSVATREPPLVSGEDGLFALRTAVEIADQVRKSRERFKA